MFRILSTLVAEIRQSESLNLEMSLARLLLFKDGNILFEESNENDIFRGIRINK